MKQYKFIVLTQDEQGVRLLKALPGQVDATGNDIDTDAEVVVDAAVKTGYPEGTIFATDLLWKGQGQDRYFGDPHPYPVKLPDGYCFAGAKKTSEQDDIFGMVEENNEKQVALIPEHEQVDPTVVNDMKVAFEAYEKAGHNTVAAKTAAPKKPAGKTLLQTIVSDYPIPTIDKDSFFVDPRVWRRLVRNLLKHGQQAVNTLLYGETGTGKTELVKLAAGVLGLPCRVYDMSSMYDPLTQMLGTHRLKDGASQFDLARFAIDIQSPGVILLDEISRADPSANNILLQVLDGRRSLNIEQASGEEERVVEVHPECVFVATANFGAGYVGTNELDDALKNRVNYIHVKSLSRDDEIALLVKRYDIPRKAATNIVDCIGTLRTMYEKQEISTNVSTRESLQVAHYVSDGWSVADALLDTLEDKCDPDEAIKVRTTIQKY